MKDTNSKHETLKYVFDGPKDKKKFINVLADMCTEKIVEKYKMVHT